MKKPDLGVESSDEDCETGKKGSLKPTDTKGPGKKVRKSLDKKGDDTKKISQTAVEAAAKGMAMASSATLEDDFRRSKSAASSPMLGELDL